MRSNMISGHSLAGLVFHTMRSARLPTCRHHTSHPSTEVAHPYRPDCRPAAITPLDRSGTSLSARLPTCRHHTPRQKWHIPIAAVEVSSSEPHGIPTQPSDARHGKASMSCQVQPRSVPGRPADPSFDSDSVDTPPKILMYCTVQRVCCSLLRGVE